MGELNTGSVWADEVPPARIAQDAAAYPMFGGQRFLWVRHAESLPTGDALAPLLAYIENPVDSTVLVLTSSKLDKRLKLTSACAANGRVVEFAPLPAAELPGPVARARARCGGPQAPRGPRGRRPG
jgi:DNA polymerase III delta subunit